MRCPPCNAIDSCRGVTRRSFLADTGMGFTGLALGAMLLRTASCAAKSIRGAYRPERPAALRAQGQDRHLDLPLRRRQPRRELRRQAGAEQVRRQDDRRDAVQGRARRRAQSTRTWSAATPAHGNRKMLMGLQTGYQKYGQCGLEVGDWCTHIGDVRRRPRRRPLAVDDRQRPRRAAHLAHRPASARRGVSRRSARGSATAWAR